MDQFLTIIVLSSPPDEENKEFNENIPRGGKGHFGGQILLFNQMEGDNKAKLNLQFLFVYHLGVNIYFDKKKNFSFYFYHFIIF